MKKIRYILSLAIVGITMCACSDDYESYEELRDYENSRLSSFLDNPTCGEIKGKKINVISEEKFLKDTITDVSKNEFVLLESGVYMQIVRRGCGSILKDGESATMICRFKEYNINAIEDSLVMQLYNDAPNDSPWEDQSSYDKYDKIDVIRSSGKFIPSWSLKEDNTGYQSSVYNWYYNFCVTNYGIVPSVPQGWVVPLSYIKLGRPKKESDEIAKVRLIVPHDMGHVYADKKVCAFYYEITYERGI